MNMSEVTKLVKNTGRYIGIKMWKHSPMIFAVGGTAGIITAGVMACKATLKLEDTVAESTERIENVKKTYDISSDDKDESIEKSYRRDLFKEYCNAGWKIAKLYGPSVMVCATGIGFIFTSKKIMDQRYSSLLAACTTTEKLFKDYRERVKDDLGVEADQKYRFGLETSEVDVPELDKKGNFKKDKDGNVKTKKEKYTTLKRDIPDSDFARVFEEGMSKEWDRNVDVNMIGLLQKQKYANDMLRGRGYLFLNEVYEMLGFPVTPAGQDVGWVYIKENDTGDNYVDFGLYKAYKPGCKETRLEMMSREINAIVLDFNVDGYIKDKLFEAQNIFD